MSIGPLGSAIVAADTSMSAIGPNDLGGILMVTNRNACIGKLTIVLFAFATLAGFQLGFAEDQDIHQLREAAVQGDACAQSTLGLMYAMGAGVPENDREAGKWFRLAADQGHAEAQFNLGTMYNKGIGVPESDVEASKWFQLAADQGHAEAQFNLGFMYANGEGVPEDYVKAYMWGNLAAAEGGDRVVNPSLTRLSATRLLSTLYKGRNRLLALQTG